MKRHFLIAIALFLHTNPAIAKQEPLRLKPSSDWHMIYEEDYCRLARTFGEGKDTVGINLEQYGDTDWFWLSMTGKPLKVWHRSSPISVQFGPLEAEQKPDYFPGNAGNGDPAIIMRTAMRIAPIPEAIRKLAKESDTPSPLPPITEERKKSVRELVIKGSVRREVALELKGMASAFQAMQTCTDHLMTRWGFDPKAYRALSRPPEPKVPPHEWARPNDYPASMLQLGKLAIVHFRLNVDAAGDATQCEIQRSLGNATFDAAVCKIIMRRAKFEPALDAKRDLWRLSTAIARFSTFRSREPSLTAMAF